MASTAAVDVRFVDSWSDEGLRAEAGSNPTPVTRTDFEADPQSVFQPSSGPSVPPWTGRRLGDALADLGPVRPYPDAVENPLPQASLERAAAALAPSSREAVAAPLPPPPRPTRTAQPFHAADVFAEPPGVRASPDFDLNWPTAPSMARDAHEDGHDIVRALADLAPRTDQAATMASLARAAHSSAIDPDERPPMIIERARVEQELGLSLDEVSSRLNPVPGLAVGGVMALMTGVILYLVMTAA
jgi:hypothetical protein